MRLRQVALALVVTAIGWARLAGAQSTTGTISGHVTDITDLPLPGVIVVVASPNLQGERSTVTSALGDYALSLLPPGTYTVTFDLAGFRPQNVKAILTPTQTLPVNATLDPSLTEQVTIVGTSSHVVTQSAQVATNFRQDVMAALPTNRDINAALLLAPSVHATGVGGAYSIAGAMSFESLFMINGVSVSDNLRGQPYDLYIEDAIQETTVASAGISAEYGRFSGGVVNVITKSGGNLFAGSFSDSLYNDKWRAYTPFEQRSIAADPNTRRHQNRQNRSDLRYTIGGPIDKDRLWFFSAGRAAEAGERRAAGADRHPVYVSTDGHSAMRGRAPTRSTVEPSVSRVVHRQHRNAGQPHRQNFQHVMDLNSLYDAPAPDESLHDELQRRAVVDGLFFEARFSARNETLKDVGARSQDLDRRHAARQTAAADVTGRRPSAASAAPKNATARNGS